MNFLFAFHEFDNTEYLSLVICHLRVVEIMKMFSSEKCKMLFKKKFHFIHAFLSMFHYLFLTYSATY